MSKPFLNTFGRKRPAVDIRRDFYTMASMDGENAEITMYGEIVDAQPVDYRSLRPAKCGHYPGYPARNLPTVSGIWYFHGLLG